MNLMNASLKERELNNMKHKIYDPEFGDHRMCKCGHVYYYHFNPRTLKHYGCVFSYNCDCEQFEEKGIRACCKETGCKAHIGCS